MTAEAQRRRRVAATLAGAFRDGVWVPVLMAQRGAHDLGVARNPCFDQIAEQVVASFPASVDDAPRRLAMFITRLFVAHAHTYHEHEVFAWIRDPRSTDWAGPASTVAVPISMRERRWPVQEIDTAVDLARFLGLQLNELEWYADVRSLERSVADENLRHYTYRWRSKRTGGARLLEAPKQNLKSFQRKLLRTIVQPIPPHDAAHGFCAGRSIQSFAAPHAGRDVVIRMDLLSFFTAIPPGRIFRIFRTAGYAEDVAHTLTGLVTNTTPGAVLNKRPGDEPGSRVDRESAWLRGPHLPQGAPTSPALSNLAAFGLDRRLTALARSFDAHYTRYADDLAFSGGSRLARHPERLISAVTKIVTREGFWVNPAKTQVRTQTQRQVLTGLVVNSHLNVHRRDYDELKAILHDAVRHGPDAANRAAHPAFRSHIEGRISFVQATNPARARKLWRRFDQITW